MVTKKNSSIISFCFATILSFLPFNFIVGSYHSWFSFSSMAMPALAYHYSLLYVILYIFTKTVFTSSISYLFLVHRLPLFFGSSALQFRSFRLFVIVPFLSMMLFCMHAVGSQVFYYSLYWFIPILIYFFVKDTLYSRALASSFIMHAIGSVVWLYCGNINALTWTALIPLVLIERIIIASGMVGCIAIFQYIDTFSTRKVFA